MAVSGGGLGDEREKEGTGLRKRRMARRGSIIENSVGIVKGQDGGSTFSGERRIKINIHEKVDQLNQL